jgi:hypothetical protein
VVSKPKHGMKRSFVLLCSVALLSATAISAQQKISPSQILPNQFRDWKRTSCLDKPVRLAAEARLSKEAPEKAYEACSYSSGKQSVGIGLGLYQDPSAAYEVYTSLQRPGMMPAKLGQTAAFDKDGVLIQEGALVMSSSANISREDLAALVAAVEAKSEKTTPLPPIRTYLPTEGRLVGSERYALGPAGLKAALGEAGQSADPAFIEAVGFNNGGEAMLARYSQPGKGTGVLLLLEYPTPNVAEQEIHHLAEVLPASAKVGEQNLVRKGSLLSIVLAPSSPEYAARLRDAANYETQVTWNEPHQTYSDPPLLSTIAKIFIGTGVFMVAAVVLGIAFGGVRIITKRLFPGKVFDRPEHIEVLQLGLSGKRIDPTDMY